MTSFRNQRHEWSSLPVSVRREVEERAGSGVLLAETQPGGFTSGVAAILTFEDDTRSFVKAVAVTDGMADEYRHEAVIAAQLPPTVPAPCFQYSFEASGWIVLSFEALAGRLRSLPWQDDDLERASASI